MIPSATSNRVLLVDDEPQVLRALKDLLEDDYDVRTRTSPREALTVLREESGISVVISDQRMPEMTGDEFLARVREVSQATRLLITGYSDLNAVIRAINEGKIFGYISKPWDPDSLTMTVHKAVEHFELARELVHERALLHNLMDSLPDEISFKDAARAYLRINGAKAAALGVADPQDAVGRTDFDFPGVDDAEAVRRIEDEIFSTGRPVVDRVGTARAADGQTRWYSSTTAPIRDARGMVASLVSVARDITERERARQALAASEERYRSLYNTTPAMMQSVDAGGRLVSVSDHWCEALGRRREDVLGRPATVVMTESGRRVFEAEVLPALAEGRPVKDVECQLTAADGRVLDTLVSAVVDLHHAREDRAFHFVIVDVTEKKRLESQLLQAQKMEAVGQLAGGIAHDFNNLLMVVIGYLDLAAEVPPGEMLDVIATVLRAAERGTELTHRLLAFSRRQTLQQVEVDLNQLVSDLIDMLRRTLGANVVIETGLAQGLWPTLADKGQLESALLNMAINARDAMPAGGSLRIESANVRLDERGADVEAGDYVMLAVRDNGQGMSREVLDRAIEPFFTTKEPGRGTGLGLSMIYGFARQSGGHLAIDSAPGRGTTVRLYLPRLRADVQPKAEADQLAGGTLRGTETILVAEDNPDVRRIVVLQLRSLGYRVLEAADGAAALALLTRQDEAIDLLFSDMMMPGGVTAARLSEAAARREPPVAALFSSGDPTAVPSSGEAAVPRESILPKPYKKQDLARRIREALTSAVKQPGGPQGK